MDEREGERRAVGTRIRGLEICRRVEREVVVGGDGIDARWVGEYRGGEGQKER